MRPDPARPALRASDAEREATAERLRFAAVEGRLDPHELDERLSAVYASRFCHELAALVADVTPPPVPAQTPRPVFIRPAPTTNALAICSLLSAALWMGGFGSILAILLGHAALRQISRAGGRQGGRGVALAGLTLGYLSLLLFALLVISFAVS